MLLLLCFMFIFIVVKMVSTPTIYFNKFVWLVVLVLVLFHEFKNNISRKFGLQPQSESRHRKDLKEDLGIPQSMDTEYTLPAVIPSIRFFSSSIPGGFHSLLEVMTRPVFLKAPTGFNVSLYYLVLMWGNDFNISSRQAGCAGVKLDMTSEITHPRQLHA